MWRLAARVAYRRRNRVLVLASVVTCCVATQAALTRLAFAVFAPIPAGTHPRPSAYRLSAIRRDMPMRASRFVFTEEEWRSLVTANIPGIDGIGAYGETQATLTTRNGSRTLTVMVASAELLESLGVVPSAGTIAWRGRRSADMGVVLSDRVVSGFALLPREVLGIDVDLNKTAWSAQGVATSFSGLESSPVGAFVPIDARDRLRLMGVNLTPGRHWLQLVVSTDVAPQRLVARLGSVLAAGSPLIDSTSVRLESLNKELTDERSTLSTLVGFAAATSYALTLLLFVNFAYLISTQSSSRAHELEIHRALGANANQLTLWLGIEPIVGMIGGALTGEVMGSLLASPGIAGLFGIPPGALQNREVPVLGLLVPLVPLATCAVPLFWRSVASAARWRFRTAHALHRTRVLRSLALVATHVLLTTATLIVVVSVGLSVRALLVAQPGFGVDELVQVAPVVRGNTMPLQRARELATTITARLGFTAAVTNPLPTGAFEVASVDWEKAGESHGSGSVEVLHVDYEYFHTVGVGVRFYPGRGVRDWSDGNSVLVASANLANSIPAGACVRVGGGDAPCNDIIGVVDDAFYRGQATRASSTVYMPFASGAAVAGGIFVHSPGHRASVQQAIKAEIEASVVADVSLGVQPVASILARTDNSLRATASVLIVILLLTASIGVWGVGVAIRHAVSTAERKMTIARALGAGSGDLCRLVLASTCAAALVGAVIGAGAGVAFIYFGGADVFQTSVVRYDAVVFTCAGLAIAILVSCVQPIMWILAVDPAAALRNP